MKIILLGFLIAILFGGYLGWQAYQNGKFEDERKAMTVTQQVEQMVKDFEEPNMFEGVDNQLLACNKLIDEGKIYCGEVLHCPNLNVLEAQITSLEEQIIAKGGLNDQIKAFKKQDILDAQALKDCSNGSDDWRELSQKYGKLLRELGYDLSIL